jgi:hypothetical protein
MVDAALDMLLPWLYTGGFALLALLLALGMEAADHRIAAAGYRRCEKCGAAPWTRQRCSACRYRF